MRDRVCPEGLGLSVLAQPPSPCRPLLTEKNPQRQMLHGSSQDPCTNPCLLQVEARCVQAAAVGQTPIPS